MIIDYHEDIALKNTIKALQDEKVFIYPTDTLYGFGGDARSEKVISKLYELKARPEHMPVSMLIRDLEMLNEYAHLSHKIKKLINHFLPGALTLVLPAKDIKLPEKLFSLQGYLGFRIPDHEFCKNISEGFKGPIITTSVNISGQSALNDMKSILTQFGKKVEVMISDPELEKKTDAKGSTVIMITKNDELKILREGIIPEKDIYHILDN